MFIDTRDKPFNEPVTFHHHFTHNASEELHHQSKWRVYILNELIHISVINYSYFICSCLLKLLFPYVMRHQSILLYLLCCFEKYPVMLVSQFVPQCKIVTSYIRAIRATREIKIVRQWQLWNQGIHFREDTLAMVKLNVFKCNK